MAKLLFEKIEKGSIDFGTALSPRIDPEAQCLLSELAIKPTLQTD